MRAAAPPPNAALLAQVADALSWPLLLLRRDGLLLHANLAARLLLQRGEWMTLNARREVQLLDPRDHMAFVQALTDTGRQQHLMRWLGTQGAITATLAQLGGRRSGPGVPTTAASPQAASTAGAADLAASEVGDGSRPLHQPMLLALTMPHGRHADLLAFARLHALTPAETRVLQRLACGENSARAAKALGLAATTVRAQTASLRRKTGHASISALLHTLALLPPLATAAEMGGAPPRAGLPLD